MRLLLLFATVLLLSGCKGSAGPELPVSGSVTVDGSPLANATVRFYPDADTAPTSGGYGVTGTDGKFVVTGGKEKKGLVAGKYRVTVSKGQPPKPAGEENVGAVVPEIEFKDDLPPQYSDPAKTILSYSVTGDGKPIDIVIDTKKKK